jgi:hypothetical protein
MGEQQIENLATAVGATTTVAQEIEQQLRRLGVETSILEHIVERLSLIENDIKKLVLQYTPEGLRLKVKLDGSFEVYTWLSNTKIGVVEKSCVEENGIYQCLDQLLSDKLKVAQKLLDQYFLKLISLSIWLRENKEKIAKKQLNP